MCVYVTICVLCVGGVVCAVLAWFVCSKDLRKVDEIIVDTADVCMCVCVCVCV